MAREDELVISQASGSEIFASCVVHPGEGLVARWGDIFLVVAKSDDAIVALLLEQCAAVAEAGGDGRMLSRRLAGLLASYDEELPAFAVMAPVATGLGVFVQGAAQVVVGSELTISGASSLAWVDRLVPWPVTELTMTANLVLSETKPGPYNLELGIVPGAGLTLYALVPDERSADSTGDAAIEEQAAEIAQIPPQTGASKESHPGISPVLDRWPGVDRSPAAFESVVIGGVGLDEDVPRPPLPIVSKTSNSRPESTGPVVRGVYCKNGHFNDARVLFCAVCGINMVQQTPVLTDGPRPPLGVLLLDDGSAFQLDSDYVLGREPAHDDDVRSGRLRGIILSDADKSVSRAHARIELRQWDVVLIDNSSANGTYVAAEGQNSWTPLPPGTPHTLTSGSRVRLGSRTLAFNSYRGE